MTMTANLVNIWGHPQCSFAGGELGWPPKLQSSAQEAARSSIRGRPPSPQGYRQQAEPSRRAELEARFDVGQEGRGLAVGLGGWWHGGMNAEAIQGRFVQRYPCAPTGRPSSSPLVIEMLHTPRSSYFSGDRS